MVRMPNTEEVMILRKQLINELVQSAVQTIKLGGIEDGKIFWKEDWWLGINLPKEYPEMIVEVIKYSAKKQAMDRLSITYNFTVKDDSDPYKGTKRLVLVKI